MGQQHFHDGTEDRQVTLCRAGLDGTIDEHQHQGDGELKSASPPVHRKCRVLVSQIWKNDHQIPQAIEEEDV